MTRDRTDSPFIVRAARQRATDEAQAIMAAARTEAARLRAEAEAEAARLRADAEEEALVALDKARSQGLDQASAQAALLMTRAAGALDSFWREREAELRDLALAVAHRVLAALPPDEVALRLATEAIAEHAREASLVFKASPEIADKLRAALLGLEFGNRVSVSADPTLEPGGCTLLHPQGRTEVGLLAQFRAMLEGGRQTAAAR